MSDLESRRRHESEMAAILLVLFNRQRIETRTLINDRLDFDPPPSYWQRNIRKTADSLLPKLRDIYAASAMQLNTAVGVAAIAQAAENWSRIQSFRLSVQLNTTTFVTIRRILTAARADRDLQQPSGLDVSGPAARRAAFDWEVARAQALERAFGAARIDSIAPTETTRAAVVGQDETIRSHEATTGEAVEQIWHTEEDGKVCPVCSPLNGVNKSVWSRYFPFGPPTPHTNCRCWIDYGDAED